MTDERDLRDKDVDKAWREHVRDEPPRALDDAIRAAAHRAVQSGPRAADKSPRRAWTAWVPLAVAATLGAIALGVVQLAPQDSDATRDVVSDAAVPAQRGATSRGQSSAPTAQPTQAGTPSTPPSSVPSVRPPSAPMAQPATPLSQPATTPAPVAPAVRKNEAERGGRPPSAASDGVVAAQAPRESGTPSNAPAANRAAEDKLAPTPAPDPFPATAPLPGATNTEKPDAKRATATTRLEGASRDAAAAPSRESQMTSPARKEQAAEPAVDSARRKDTAQFAERAAGAAAPAAPPPSLDAASRAAPATSEAAPAAQSLAKAAPLRSPDDYFNAMRRLRDEGREADAIATLTAYRAAFGDDDQKLPGDLRLWAMRVTRP